MKNRFVVVSILLIVMMLANNSKGVAMAEKPDYKTEIKEKLKQVNLSDGVSKEEAIIIAQNELIEKSLEEDCNISKPIVNESRLVEGCWFVKFNTTLKVRMKSGLLWCEFHIDKKTGEIKVKGWSPDL